MYADAAGHLMLRTSILISAHHLRAEEYRVVSVVAEMSVFRGSIAEYPGVIVDHFIASNCGKGRAFFLSHCHKDHMTGLSSPAIVTALQRHHTHLYCSEVTHSLLLKDPGFTHLAPYLKGLPMEEPVAMTLGALNHQEELSFTVTLLPAGHCPGSSMFFFQGSEGNVLYTGDFRLTLEETKRLQPLHCGGSLLDITALYVDTTFFHPIATEIPSRDTSRDCILRLIESWLTKDPTNVVHLQCAMFGFEHIYIGINKKFNTKIHIAAWRINAYKEISAVTDCLTTDGESTRIHACNFRKGVKGHGLPCGSHKQKGIPKVMGIKPSTQWFLFSDRATAEPYVYLPEVNKYRVIHSMHASYSELHDFVTYLKPKRIIPCVIPFGDTSLADVCTRLKGLLPHSEVNSTGHSHTVKLARPKSKGKSARHSSHGEGEDGDGWLTGDESINEFPSSEEQLSAEDTTFSHSRPVAVALPSLISVKQLRTSPPSSNDTATCGSLQQSPIDLSLDACSTVSSSQETASPTDPSSEQPIELPDEDNTPKHDQLEGSEGEGGDEEQERTVKRGARGNDKNLRNVGLLHIQASPSTPPSKRLRLTDTRGSVSRKLFSSREGKDGHSEVSRTVDRPPEDSTSHSTPVFIDLTQDEEDSDLDTSQQTSSRAMRDLSDVQTDHPLIVEKEELDHSNMTSTVAFPLCQSEPAIVIELSDSQSTGSSMGPPSSQPYASVESGSGYDPLGSPSCLPPTPGRENVNSILQRKDFTFT